MIDPTLSVGYDLTFELNEFNQPKLQSEVELVKNVILFVLFSKHGQYPSLPHIGLDIQSILYSFYDELDTEDLKDRLIQQCGALGAFFDKGSVQIMKNIYRGQPSLMIHVSGLESYPDGYMTDRLNREKEYLIGITFDELNRMVYNINISG